ncbi:MAG TPA: class I SAM-dependent methyltransferase [Sedimenticola sp.]|nr:class I SAM-dependent methyltransferase [Sedimenticola sp.]
MHESQRRRIIDRHRDSLLRHGHHPHALYWSSRAVQETRFRVLSEIGIASGDSVLDVGCGFADLATWLERAGTPVCYTGIDLSPDLIAEARRQHPGLALHTGELADGGFGPQAFDWVVLSGALNEPLHDQGAYARRTILAMYRHCRRGTAFNLLDARRVRAHDLYSADPGETLAFCRTVARRCRLVEGYLPDDFTLYLYREAGEPGGCR